jgi:hypothetical protein
LRNTIDWAVVRAFKTDNGKYQHPNPKFYAVTATRSATSTAIATNHGCFVQVTKPNI